MLIVLRLSGSHAAIRLTISLSAHACVLILHRESEQCVSASCYRCRVDLDQPKRPVTAGGKSYLKSLSLARLKKYVDAYNIKVEGILEKDELISRIIASRVSWAYDLGSPLGLMWFAP